jgi:hypothetical protein
VGDSVLSLLVNTLSRGEIMFTNDPAAVRAAILAGTIQQVQAEPARQTARTAGVRGSLTGNGTSGAAAHRQL